MIHLYSQWDYNPFIYNWGKSMGHHLVIFQWNPSFFFGDSPASHVAFLIGGDLATGMGFGPRNLRQLGNKMPKVELQRCVVWSSPFCSSRDRFVSYDLVDVIDTRHNCFCCFCYLCFLIWLVVWNMIFIFPYVWNNNPNWLSYFSEG